MSQRFSVIIPTKNRSNLIGYAIQSVLNQTFRDFEIVIVDNDDTSATADVVQQFDDSRICYCRTGNLSMADNWERGFQQSRGKYVTVVADRRVLKSYALERIDDIIKSHRGAQVVSWYTETIDDVDTNELFFRNRIDNRTQKVCAFTANELLRDFLEFTYHKTMYTLPKGLNSVIHRSLIETIVRGPSNRLCLPIAPDYSMAFLQLAYHDHFLYYDHPLSIQGNRDGFGQAFHRKHEEHNQTTKSFVDKAGGQSRFYDNVAVKAVFTQNFLFNDYERIRELVLGYLAHHPLQPVTYYKLCYQDIVNAQGLGVNMDAELQAWHNALASEPEEIQSRVSAFYEKSIIKDEIGILRQKILRLLHPIVRRYKKGRFSPIFPNILSALQWREQQV